MLWVLVLPLVNAGTGCLNTLDTVAAMLLDLVSCCKPLPELLMNGIGFAFSQA